MADATYATPKTYRMTGRALQLLKLLVYWSGDGETMTSVIHNAVSDYYDRERDRFVALGKVDPASLLRIDGEPMPDDI